MHDIINYEVSVMEETINKKGIAESMDMTTGSLWKKIFLFSMPLMTSQILQVLFNMADIAVVGTFSSSQSAQRAYLSRCLPDFLSVWAAA